MEKENKKELENKKEKEKKNSLEKYCDENPGAVECKVYDV